MLHDYGDRGPEGETCEERGPAAGGDGDRCGLASPRSVRDQLPDHVTVYTEGVQCNAGLSSRLSPASEDDEGGRKRRSPGATGTLREARQRSAALLKALLARGDPKQC